MEELSKGTFCVALMSNDWSERDKEDYVSVFIHCVDVNWVLYKRIVGFHLLDVSHATHNISERILNVLVNYDLRNSVIVVMLDNLSANNAAIEIMRPLLTRNRRELFHHRCACHIVNFIVKDDLDLFYKPIDITRQSITYVNAKSTRVHSFKTFCRHNVLRARTFGPTNDIGGI